MCTGAGGGRADAAQLSACTCDGEDHPGPTPKRGRGAPEIDILEAEKDKNGRDGGSVSQSAQFAPFNINYEYNPAGIQVFSQDITGMNTFKCVQARRAALG